MAGQSVGMVTAETPVRELVDQAVMPWPRDLMPRSHPEAGQGCRETRQGALPWRTRATLWMGGRRGASVDNRHVAAAPGRARRLRRARGLRAGHGAAMRRAAVRRDLERRAAVRRRRLVSEVCSIYVMRPGEILELAATHGLNPAAVGRTRLRVGEGIVGLCAATQEVMNLAGRAEPSRVRLSAGDRGGAVCLHDRGTGATRRSHGWRPGRAEPHAAAATPRRRSMFLRL